MSETIGKSNESAGSHKKRGD